MTLACGFEIHLTVKEIAQKWALKDLKSIVA